MARKQLQDGLEMPNFDYKFFFNQQHAVHTQAPFIAFNLYVQLACISRT